MMGEGDKPEAQEPLPETSVESKEPPDAPDLPAVPSGEEAAPTDDQQSLEQVTCASLAGLEEQVRCLQETIQALVERAAAIEESLRDASERIACWPPQIVALGKKVEALDVSIGNENYRKLLERVLQLYDMAQHALQATRAQAETGIEVNHERNYEALVSQMLYILSLNGVEPVPVAEEFDPTVHEAVTVEPVPDPERVGKIVRTLLTGFRTRDRVLRPAKVATGVALQPAAPEPAPDTVTEAAAPPREEDE